MHSRQKDRKMRKSMRGDGATPQPVIIISVFLSRGSSRQILVYKEILKVVVVVLSAPVHIDVFGTCGSECVVSESSQLVQLLHHTVFVLDCPPPAWLHNWRAPTKKRIGAALHRSAFSCPRRGQDDLINTYGYL